MRGPIFNSAFHKGELFKQLFFQGKIHALYRALLDAHALKEKALVARIFFVAVGNFSSRRNNFPQRGDNVIVFFQNFKRVLRVVQNHKVAAVVLAHFFRHRNQHSVGNHQDRKHHANAHGANRKQGTVLLGPAKKRFYRKIQIKAFHYRTASIAATGLVPSAIRTG